MADPKPHIFDGTKWLPLQGADGAEGPTVVSADAKNLAKLGTDGKLLVSQPDLDAIYVNLAGDKMTGPLAVQVGATFTPPATAINTSTLLHVVREGGSALAELYSVGSGTAGILFRRKNGTLAAPTPVSNANLGVIRWQVKPNNGAADRTVGQIAYAINSPETEDGYFDNTLGIGGSGYAAGQPSAGLTLAASAAAGRVGTLSIDTFVCTATNFTVNSGGGVTTAAGITVKSGGINVVDGGISAAVPSGGGAGSFRSSDNGNGETGLGLLGAAAGTSATSGGVTGVRGEVTGTVSTGIGVSSDVTATATQNYGFATTVRGGTRNCGLYVDVPKGTGSYAVQFQGDADSYFKSNVGIGWSTPSVLLEVGGATKLRTTLEVVGNITSAGTAHNFAAKSIPASAINGVPTLKADDLTDVTVTTPAAGQVLRWNGTAFVNSVLNYSDLTGTAPGGGMTQADADNRYVNITGDTMTGDLIVNAKLGVGVTPLTGFHVKTPSIFLEGFTNTTALTATAPSAFGGSGESLIQANATVSSGSYTAVLARTRGTDNNPSVPRVGDFAFRSDGPAPSQLGGDLTVSGKLIGDRPYVAVTSSYDLTLAARSATIANVSTGAATVTISIPLNGSAAFAIGSRLEILDLSATSATVISAVAGVTLNWNATLTGGAAAVAGGVGASLTLPGPLFRVTLIKTGTDTWVVLN
jgi:hypothetical protein